MKKTVDDQIKDRLYAELKTRRGIFNRQRVVDDVLEETTSRIETLLASIADEVVKQQAAMGHLKELRANQEDYAHHANETASLGVNLANVFFKSDVNLFVKHLMMAEDEVIVLALSHDVELLNRVRELIERIDSLSGGLTNE